MRRSDCARAERAAEFPINRLSAIFGFLDPDLPSLLACCHLLATWQCWHLLASFIAFHLPVLPLSGVDTVLCGELKVASRTFHASYDRPLAHRFLRQRMHARLSKCAAYSSRFRLNLPALRTPSVRLVHSACILLKPSPAISVYPARQQTSEEEREGESGSNEEAAAEANKSQRPAIRRRRANTFRSKAADVSNLFSSSAAAATSAPSSSSADDSSSPPKRRSRRSRSSGQSAEADGTSDIAQADHSTPRSSYSSTSSSAYSSSPRRPSLSALPSSAFGASSVTGRPSFGIQQVLAFVYSYLPKPTQAQIAAAQHSQQKQPQPQQPHTTNRSHTSASQQQPQPASHSHSHPYSSHTAGGVNAHSASASATSLFPSSSAPLPPPSSPRHPVSVYDVSSRSIFNDYVVVLLVSSSRQMSFLSSQLYKKARASNAAPLNRNMLSLSGRTRDDWQSVDLGSVVVHIFNARARLTKPGLDYHPEAVMDESLAVSAGGMWGVRAEDERSAEELLLRHAVIDNIERQFGDLQVPLDKFDALRDYSTSEAGQGERKGEEATMLVNDTSPVYGAAASTAQPTTRAAEASSAAVK